MNEPTTIVPRWLVRLLLIALAIGLGLASGLVIRSELVKNAPVQSFASDLQVPALGEGGTQGELRNAPLTIPAQRARQYPGGKVTVIGAYPDGPGYRSERIAYASDGLKIFAQTVLPVTPEPPKGYPVIILIHGNIIPSEYESDEAYYSAYATDFARRGFLVVKPDLRGFGESWGTAEGAYFSPGYNADILNLATSLGTYGPADTRRMGLFGHSMGANVALDVLAIAPTRFQAAVIASGSVGTPADMFHNWQAGSDLSDPVTSGTRRRMVELFGEPDETQAFWKSVSPYTFLKEVSDPIQIQYALDDTTVPIRFSENLTTALMEAGHKPDVQSYDTGAHPLSGPTHDLSVADAAAFFERSF